MRLGLFSALVLPSCGERPGLRGWPPTSPALSHDPCVHGSVSPEPQRAAHVRTAARCCSEWLGSSSAVISGPHARPVALPEAPRCWSEVGAQAPPVHSAQALHLCSACHPLPAGASVSPLTTHLSVPRPHGPHVWAAAACARAAHHPGEAADRPLGDAAREPGRLHLGGGVSGKQAR